MIDTEETIRTAARHHQAGNFDQAEEQYRLVLETQPDNASVLHLLGIIAHQKGDNRLAVDLISKAIAGEPQAAQFHNNLAVALKALGKFKEALNACEKALSLKPDYADAYYNMANLLDSLGRPAAAIELYNHALALAPNDPYIYYNMAVALQKLGRHTDAIENFQHAINLNHNAAEVYRAMAASQKALGRHTDAGTTLAYALSLHPDCAQTHTDLGMQLLLLGNFKQGFSEYRWRLNTTAWIKHCPAEFRWDGSNFANKKLLVRCEQGLGDNIQFVRYLPMVKARGGTVIFGVYQQLYSLLKGFPGVDETVNLSDENQSLVFDLYSPIMDLPGIFGTTLETIPARVPYIFADPAKVEHWRGRISGPGFKVGIFWAGTYETKGKHLRHCKLADFAILSAIDGVSLYSLQKGPGIEQIEQSADRVPVVNLGKDFEDFSDTAAAIENLDLVISVDTSVIHLAGAMGRPTWSLHCFSPDWRWLLNRNDSPWYPTMKLFRQKKLGRWDDVFQEMAEQLKVLVGNKTS